jgi:hypothetical protein
MKSLEEVLRIAIQNQLAQVHVSLPATIVSYSAAQQKAVVQPSIKKEYTDGKVDTLPEIDNVPVIFSGCGARGGISFPLKKGDGVLLVFSERSLDNWIKLGGTQKPGDRRKFDLTDAIAIAGLESFKTSRSMSSSSEALFWFGNSVLKLGESTIALGSNGVELLDILSQTLQGLVDATVVTETGPKPLVNFATFTALKAQLDQIKGSL